MTTICRCDWLGIGTPEHEASPLCRSLRPDAERITFPNPNITGPCQLQASPFCENVGIQRLDPMAMLTSETAFTVYLSACLICYEVRADRYVAEVHA